MVNVSADLKKVLEPTWMENWYEELKDLTIPAEYFRVSIQDLEAMCDIIDGNNSFSADFDRRLMQLIVDVKKKYACKQVFFRLGSRSPKDSRFFGPVSYLLDVVDQMANSMRFGEDVVMCHCEGYLPYIFIRPWIDIKKCDEFRCFCKDGRLMGISQYFYKEEFFYLNNEIRRNEIMSQVQKLLDKILARIHLKDFVFDVVCHNNEAALLIELNPWSSWTDPCMFDWAQDKFDCFEFRWVHD